MEIERQKALEIHYLVGGKLLIPVIIRNIMLTITQIRPIGFIPLRPKPYHQDGSKVMFISFIVVVMNVTFLSYSDEIRAGYNRVHPDEN